MGYKHIKIPANGAAVKFNNFQLEVPDNPIIPFIEGDGIGVDIWAASVRIFDAAVKKTYNNKRKISWMEIFAGEKAKSIYGEDLCLPPETIETIKTYRVGIKGPVACSLSGGDTSINSKIKKSLDLYANIHCLKYYTGSPSPVKNPENINLTVFREDSEDSFAGVEFQQNSEGALEIKEILARAGILHKLKFPDTACFGISSISREGTERIIRAAIKHAIEHNLSSVTIVHRGNILKHTEGNFAAWAYELARNEFTGKVISWDDCGGNAPPGTILLRDVAADLFFQQIITTPGYYSVIVTLHQNGDCLSGVISAQIGGSGMIPGGTINYESGYAIFEATHGPASKYAGFDKANPSSLVLSGAMMLDHLGWKEAAGIIRKSFQTTIVNKIVTYDLARLIDGAVEVKCSEFADAIIRDINQ